MTERDETEMLAVLRRAGIRAAYHLMRAGVEGLKAVEAIIEELARSGRPDPEPDQGPERIEVE